MHVVLKLLLGRDEDERFEVAVDDIPSFELHPVIPALTQYCCKSVVLSKRA